MPLKKWLLIDYDLIQTILLRSWSILSGIVTVSCIPFWFTANQQGYYYTFNSLLGLQLFFDMGLNYVVIQIVSHEYATLKINSKGYLKGKAEHISRLANLLSFLERWYRFIAVAFLFIVGSLGSAFLAQDGTLSIEDWLPAWLMLVVTVSVNLYLGPRFALMEGCGKVGEIAKVRLQQSIIATVLIWILLSCNFGLPSMAVGQWAGLWYVFLWLRRKANIIIGLKKCRRSDRYKISWRQEIFPMQWKIALSWMSGYFIFQFITPMIFRHQGAIDAGRLGLTQSIFSTIQGFGMSWVMVKMPGFGGLIAKGDRVALNQLFFSALTRSLLFTSLASAGFTVFIYACINFSLPLAGRLVEPSIAICLSMVTLINIVVFSVAAYCRAHKEEPFLASSVVSGLLIACAAYVGSLYSLSMAIYLYLAVALLIGLPWSLIIFKRYYFYART